jgi:hypothetical protein
LDRVRAADAEVGAALDLADETGKVQTARAVPGRCFSLDHRGLGADSGGR